MARVEIQFVGKDDVSGTIKTIEGDVKDLGKEAENADKKSKGLGVSLGGIGKLALGAGIGLAAGAVAGLGAALIGGMGDARQANLIFAQSEAVIASTGGAAGVSAQHVADYASALSDAAGKSLFGDDQIAESTNLLLTFTNIKGTVLDAATAISVDMAQALGGAPKDAAVQLGKALNDPIAGISALSRVGVTFSEDQKAVIQSMMDTGNVAGAQQVIIAELNKEFGGSAAAAAAAAGPMAQFKGELGEMAESIGAQLLPLLDQFVTWLTSPAIQDAIVAIGTGLVNAVLAAVAGFQTFLTAISPIVSFVQDNLTAVLAALATMLIVVVVPAFVTWAAAASAAAIATITALAPVLLPIAAIGAAVGLLVTAWNRDWGGMRTTITAWWTGTVEPILTTVQEWLREHIPQAVETLRQAWDTGVAGIRLAINLAKDYIGDFRATVSTAIDAVIGFFAGLPGRITGAIGDLGLLLVSSGQALVAGLQNGIANAWGRFLGWINDQINKIPAVIRNALGIHSPARVMIPLGQGIVEGLQQGIELQLPSLQRSLLGGIADLLAGAKATIEADGAAVIAAMQQMVAGINNAAAGVQMPSDNATYGVNPPSVRYPLRYVPPNAGRYSGQPVDTGTPVRYLPADDPNATYNAKDTNHITYIDARGATDPRGVEAAVDRALLKRGLRTDLRLRTT